MAKKRKKPDTAKKPSAAAMERACGAIELIAVRYGTTPEMVRKHIQLAMINGLVSEDPKVKAAWERIPKMGEIPTPEELIAYYSERLKNEQ